jgi:hypothetical protein
MSVFKQKSGSPLIPIHPQRGDERMPREISTLPNWRMRFLPASCLSRSFRLRVAPILPSPKITAGRKSMAYPPDCTLTI